MKKEAGHRFLAKLGKKRLRPGGQAGTSWLIQQAKLNQEMFVLEVACNMGTTAIELVKTYGCHLVGLDSDEVALQRARDTAKQENLDSLLEFVHGNAIHLPFDDNTFDVVINEAMLTMLHPNAKQKAISEYYRVLKPGGILLTHDVTFLKVKDKELIAQLSETINVNVSPLYDKDWIDLFKSCGFRGISYQTGKMSLMSPLGMVRDEGLLGTMRIIKNGLKTENRQQFFKMFQFFNHVGKKLSYIIVASKKMEGNDE